MKYLTEHSAWATFYPQFNQSFFIEKAGYFDERPQVHTSATQLLVLVILPFLVFYSVWFLVLTPFLFFGWGKLYINLPIKTGIQDCDSAAWGFNYHDNTIWIYIGGGGNFEGGKKWITFTMPWYLNWYRTSILLKDGTWEHEYKGSRKSFYEASWKEKQAVWDYVYTDSFDGEIVPAKIYVEEREWRMKGLMWTSLFNKVRKTIDVHFSKEVGKEKGSWKGGTIGCGREMIDDETPLECIKKMEKEEKF